MKKASYDSEDLIPEEDKHLYKKAGGKWILKVEEFEGLDELVAPALKTNNTKLKEEKDNANARATAAENSKQATEDELNKLKKPGTRTITEDEYKTLEAYQEIGPVADIKRDLEAKGTLEGEVQKTAAEKEAEKVATAAKLNPDALKDFIFNTTYGKGLKPSTKEVKEKVGKEEVVRHVPYVSYDIEDNGKTKTETKTLEDYLKEKAVPEYMSKALFENKAAPAPRPSVLKDRVRIPEDSTRKAKEDNQEPEVGVGNYVKKFNDNRSTRKLPWSAAKEEK